MAAHPIEAPATGRPRLGTPGPVNFSDRYLLQLQDAFVRQVNRETDLKSLGHRDRSPPASPQDTIQRWRSSMTATSPVQIQWARYCTPVGDGRRGGTRCRVRFCPNCMAIRHNELRREVGQRLAASPKSAIVRMVRVSQRHVLFRTVAEARDRLPQVLGEIRRETRAGLKELDIPDGLVITVASKLERFQQHDPIQIERGWGIQIESWFLFVSDRTPQPVYLHVWPQRVTLNSPRNLARLLMPLLQVPAGLGVMQPKWFWEFNEQFAGVRSVAFQGQWRTAHPAGGDACDAPPVRCSRSASVLLDALGAPSPWIKSLGVAGVDLEAISRQLPIRLVESPVHPEHLLDLERPEVMQSVLAAAVDKGNAHDDRPVGVVFAVNGMPLVLLPESFDALGPAATGNQTRLVFRHFSTQYVLAPLGGARFIRTLWSQWRPPWARPHQKPPRFGQPNVMSPCLRKGLVFRRGLLDGEQHSVQRDEDRAAVRELYKSLGWGRFAPCDDQLGRNWQLDEASLKRLDYFVLHALNKAHGQGLDEVFNWPRGVVGAEVEHLFGLETVCPLLDSQQPRGVVFSLYRRTPGVRRRSEGLFRGAIRVVLHNDRELVGEPDGRLDPQAQVMAVVSIPDRGEFYLQRARDFYARLRTVRPWLVNPQPLSQRQHWPSRQQRREWYRYAGQLL